VKTDFVITFMGNSVTANCIKTMLGEYLNIVQFLRYIWYTRNIRNWLYLVFRCFVVITLTDFSLLLKTLSTRAGIEPGTF